MAQIIAKFGYLKGKSRGGYAKYIATREGVEKLDESLRDRPVTQAQQEFIQKLLMDFPDSKDLLEYEDYQKSPTLGSASEFISAALELHMGELSGRSGYLKYMGTRPRVEKQGSHGLFSYAGEPISLNKVAQEVDAHRGNIWTAIYSLRREDAQRLGFDTAARWRDLLRSQAVTLAEGLKIAPSHLKWYAAFHNEGHHPHVHLICLLHQARRGVSHQTGHGHHPLGAGPRDFPSGLDQRVRAADHPPGRAAAGQPGESSRPCPADQRRGLRKSKAGISPARAGGEAFQREGQEGLRLPAARLENSGEPDRG